MPEVPQRRTSDPTVIDQPLPLPASERTLIDPPRDALAADMRSRTLQDRPSSDRLLAQPSARPVIPVVGIDQRLAPDAPGGDRYAIGTLLGVGSSSHVYAGHDRTFDREVAIKFLETGLAQDARRLSRFVREARMTARLDHSNIVPVYNLNATPAGDLYLTMRRVIGLSLGDALRRAAEGDQPPELGDINRRVNLMLKVCDALACAHDRSIAHLDVKPDNIMLGPFGEVVLVDWGLARRFDEAPRARQHISGTPAYMSPEQSAGHPGDALADIYCLGATLFHVLTLRHPTWGTDEVEFWAKKRAGIIDPPTSDERRRIPKQLLAIALKAIASDRAERYQSVKAMGEDLQYYQSGLAVSAYRESRLERALRWHRRYARPLWMGLTALTAMIASALYVYGERVKEVVAWGAPIYRQDFSDESWRADFSNAVDVYFPEPSRWERQNGSLVSQGNQANYIFLDRRLYGSVAIEFDGEMQPGFPAGDVSLAWSPIEPSSGPDWRLGVYRLQVGSHDNTYAAISHGDDADDYVRSAVRLVPGTRYHMRFEIDGDRLSIDLDGQRLCEYRTAFPCTSGYIGLYGFYPGKTFDNLVVYAKGVPQRIMPTAIGDSWYLRDRPLEAAEQYRVVAESYPGTPLGDQARYKQGLCLAKLNRREEALALWDTLSERRLIHLAECKRIEWSIAAGNVLEAVERFTKLYQEDQGLRPRLHLIYGAAMETTLRKKPELIDHWLALTRSVLPSEPNVDAAAARALNDLGRLETVVERYPHVEHQAAMALFRLGRPEEMLRRYPNGRIWLQKEALFNLGRLDEILSRFPQTDNRDVLRVQGRYSEIVHIAADPDGRIQDLLWQGRAEEALRDSTPGSQLWCIAMVHLGRSKEALAAERNDPTNPRNVQMRLHLYDEIAARDKQSGHVSWIVKHGQWLTAIERHDQATADAMLAEAQRAQQPNDSTIPWFTPLIAVEFVHAKGDRDSFMTAMRALAQRGPGLMAQRPWHAARYLLGEIDDATFLAQPARGHAPAALLVLRGLRAELSGDTSGARGEYRDYLAKPLRHRGWDLIEGDPVTDHFVAWRLAELGE